MNILAIETSCDETAISVVNIDEKLTKLEKRNKYPVFKVLSEVISSQINIHREFGGVVPSLAKREHIKNLPVLFESIFFDSKIKIDDIDAIAVTVGPGLEPALWTGINFAKDIAKKYNKKILGANHLFGHMYSFLLSDDKERNSVLFPALSLIVSGGHTELILMNELNKFKKLGETKDDAVGESFDKVARILGLQYPGGPAIEKLASRGNQNAIKFPMPMLHSNDYNFSYSGLKTAVLYHIKDLGVDINSFSMDMTSDDYKDALKKVNASVSDISASFQYSALGILAKKTVDAVKEFGIKSVIIGGGVAANKKLKELIIEKLQKTGYEKTTIFAPELKYCTDNASMIGVAGYFSILNSIKYPLIANGRLDIVE